MNMKKNAQQIQKQNNDFGEVVVDYLFEKYRDVLTQPIPVDVTGVKELSRDVVRGLKSVSLRALVLLIALGMNGTGLLGVGHTVGYYNDTETSTKNTLAAGAVDFSLDISGWQATTTAVSLPPGDVVMKEVDVDPQNSNPFQYYATSTNFTGDDDFCNGLQVTAELEGGLVYEGPLVDLLTSATTTLDSWKFTYTTEQQNFQNRVCHFDIDYNGWQTRHDHPSYEQGGFNDTERVEHWISSWGFRINKVYYDVASDRGVEGDNEWVEIYNQTNVPIDISGWGLCDNESCDTLPTTAPIPPMGYAFITGATTTASSTLPAPWYLAPGVEKIVLADGEIGNGLHNDADMLILKRPDGTIVDQMNWGDPDSGWTNYNDHVWDPGVPDVAEGNVLARVPSGFDTDQPSDWSELAPPSVDLIYPDEGGSYTWYWTYSYAITWTAVNNNGDDGDLDISIFYIKDVNSDGAISEGDTKHVIAETTDNDGLFDWIVPSGFIGYIWIHLVATGPENPMLNSGTVSGRIYDPIPLLIAPEELAPVIEALADDPDNEGILDATPEEPVEEDEVVDETAGDESTEPEAIAPEGEEEADAGAVEDETASEEDASEAGSGGGGGSDEDGASEAEGSSEEDPVVTDPESGSNENDGDEEVAEEEGTDEGAENEENAEDEEESVEEAAEEDTTETEEVVAEEEEVQTGDVEDAAAEEETTETEEEPVEAEEEPALEPEPEPEPIPEPPAESNDAPAE